MDIILFNKPYGVISQFSSHPRHRCLSEFIDIPGYYPAGRLDHDSEGLLVLTNHGRLQHLISHPGKKQAKTYLVQVEHLVSEEAIHQLQKGIKLKDGLTLPARARIIDQPAWLWPRVPSVRYRASIPTSWIELTIYEGRNRQVRRMTAAVGHPTLRLIRYSVGQWSIDGIPPGEWIRIPVDENLIKKLNVSTGLDTPRHRRRHHRGKATLPHGGRKQR